MRIGSVVRAALVLLLVLTPPSFGQYGFVNWESPQVAPLAITPSGNTLLAVNTADNRLELFDASTGILVSAGSVRVGLEPVTVRVRNESEAWVVNHLSDSISIVDLPTRRVVRTIQTGDEPTDVVFAGSPIRAFVSLSQLNQVSVIDPAFPAATPQIIAIEGQEPRGMAVSPDGTRVYVAIFESGNATGAVRQQEVSNVTGPYGGINPPPNAGNFFSPPIAAGLPPPPPVAQIVRRSAPGVWLDDNGRNWSQFVTWDLHDHDVAIINTQTLTVSYATGLMTHIMAIAVKPDGGVTVVGTEATNQIRFAPNLNGRFIRCEIAGFSPATPTVTSVADLNPHLNYASPNVPVATRTLSIGDPRGIVWHPTQPRAYVAGLGSNNVIVTDTTGVRVATIGVGAGPGGLGLSGDGSRLYVLNRFDATISTIDTATNSELSRTAFFDPTPTAIRLGRPLLYDTHRTSGLGQASCASCHIDARSDFLAWDLGDPQGAMKTVNEPCRQGPNNCRPWHPMKGPMVTQSFQGIVGAEPFHWRGDRENLAAFAPAFVELQGADAQPSAAEMQQMTDFVATIQYPPNPNRNLDGSMPAGIPTTGNTVGNPNTGMTLYQTLPVLGGGARCIDCHALPSGTSGTIDDPRLPLAPQAMKGVQLRGLGEKVGWIRNSMNNSKGFGFNHHSEFDTLFALLNAGFNFAAGQAGVQQRHDVEAFLLCLTNDTQAGVGAQITFDGNNNNNTGLINRLNTFVALADSGQTGLVASGRWAGLARGFMYVSGGQLQSDRSGEGTTVTALRTGAASGSEITFLVVPAGTQRRIGIDRDADGFLNQDELDAGSNPADAASTPLNCATSGDMNRDGTLDGDDAAAFVQAVVSGSSAPADVCRGDFNHNGVVDAGDVPPFVQALLSR